LSYHFGRREKTLWEKWRAQEAEGTPGAISGSLEMGSGADDADHDGVRDEIDLCPNTPPEAVGHVDARGCVVDSDNDGIADYLDMCPGTTAGMPVDSNGCPVDEDSDGVTDAIDQCPGTPRGYPVEKNGCINKAVIFKRRVLHVNYQPGGSDIDTRTGIYLDSLSQMMKDFPDLKIAVLGYTDNIGSETANRQLSQKRADKVRRYLIAKGIGEVRISSKGMGETSFIATNENKYGRELNRRIEIEFEY
jgi:OOP family OmpA-OmpF porin